MSFRLLHYSDPHFGAFDPRISRAAAELASSLEPDLTVVSGDFTMRGRLFEFELARSWLAQLPRPLLTIPGNHDVPGLNQLADRFFYPFRRYRKFISETEEPSMPLGDVGALTTANSSTPFGLHLDWSRGFLSPFQGQAVSSFFEAIPEGQLRVFGMHHPVVGSGKKERALVSPMPLVGNLFQKCQINLILAGHFHQSSICLFPNEEGNRRMIVSQAPSICSTRLKGEPNGFHLLSLERNAIAIELWRWHSDRFLPEKTKHFLRIGEGWEVD